MAYFWCIRCRLAWPESAWVANGWHCPSQPPGTEERHPHLAWSDVAAILGVEGEPTAEHLGPMPGAESPSSPRLGRKASGRRSSKPRERRRPPPA